MDRRRRGCLIAAGVAGLLLLVVILLLPRLICLVVNARLPRELGPQATLLAVQPDAGGLPPAPIVLEVDPDLARRLAADASGRWIPPGVVRHGMTAVGTLRGAGNRAVSWRGTAISGTVPPRLSITLTPDQAAALIEAAGPQDTGSGIALIPRIESLELAALPDDGTSRHFRVEAAGSLRLEGLGLAVKLPIRRLVARLTVEFTPAAAGWEPRITVAIDVLESPLPPLPGITDVSWRRMLAGWIEELIADQLANRTLPAWFPTDLAVSAVVR